MAITQSAKKALRQNKRRRAVNLQRAKALKDAIKAYKKAPSTASLATVFARLDKAAKNHLIAKNRASRIKARLSKALASKKK